MAFVAAALAALAVCGSASATPDYQSRLLNDWRDGRIDGVYPVDCDRQRFPACRRISGSTRAPRATSPARSRLGSGPDRPAKSVPAKAGAHHGGSLLVYAR